MVATIRFIACPGKAVTYNEKKVEKGMARYLGAENYPVGSWDLAPWEKKRLLEWRAMKNYRARIKGLHIFLGFAQGESIHDYRLKEISRGFMEGMGLGAQPYLVYAHEDMHREHLHLVSTPLDARGNRIPLYLRIKQGLVGEVVGALEEKYQLRSVGETRQFEQKGVLRKVRYGQEETCHALSRILDQTLNRFHYETPAEWNALLGVYRVKAFYGRPGTLMHQRGGLVYGFVDHKDRQIGLAVSASRLPQRPTIPRLEEIMAIHRANPEPPPRRLRSDPEDFLGGMPADWEIFRQEMESRGIQTSWGKREEETEPRLYFVDMIHRRVLAPGSLPPCWQYESLASRLGPWPEEKRYRLPSVGRQREMALAREGLVLKKPLFPGPKSRIDIPREVESPYYRISKGRSKL